MMSRPVVIELVGPPGSGKSTLLKKLRERDPGVVEVRRRGKVIAFYQLIKNGRQILPLFLQNYQVMRSTKFHDMLNVSRAVFRYITVCDRYSTGTAMLIYNGPLYHLARCRVLGSAFTRTSAFRQWEENFRNTCEAVFNLIIQIDAPDDVLAQRIGSSSQPRSLRECDIKQQSNHFSHNRLVYENMIAASRLPVVIINSAFETADEAADRVLRVIKNAQDRISKQP